MKTIYRFFVWLFLAGPYLTTNAESTASHPLQTLKNEIEETVWHQETLTGEQLQLLLNITTLSLMIVDMEFEYFERSTWLLEASWFLRYFPDEENLETIPLKTKINDLLELLRTKKTCKAELARLIAIINQPEHASTLTILKTMATHATRLVEYCAQQEDTAYHETIMLYKQQLATVTQQLQEAQQHCQSLVEQSDLFKEQYNTETQRRILMHRVLDAVTENTQELVIATEAAHKEMKEFQQYTSLVFHLYLQTIHDGMKTHHIDQKYFSPLVDYTSLMPRLVEQAKT